MKVWMGGGLLPVLSVCCCHSWNRFLVKVTWNCIHLSYLTWEVEDKHHRQWEQVQVDNNFLLHANPLYYAFPHFSTMHFHISICQTLLNNTHTLFSIGWQKVAILKCSCNIHDIQGSYTTTTSSAPIPLQSWPRSCSKIFHSLAQLYTALENILQHSTVFYSIPQQCTCILHGLAYPCKSESYSRTHNSTHRTHESILEAMHNHIMLQF